MKISPLKNFALYSVSVYHATIIILIEVMIRGRPPANRITFQELTRQYSLTDEQLNSKIEDSDTPKLALCFDYLEIYLNAMGLALAEQTDVKESHRIYDTQTSMMKCLKIWKKHTSQATYRALLDIVLGVGKGDTAHHICQQLTQRKSCMRTLHVM